jgi:plasmid stabilization system protein ParE
VARLVVTPRAESDVEAAIHTLNLPGDTWDRLARSLRVLEDFPLAGRRLAGTWQNHRAIIGPWGWLVAIYIYFEREDEVRVVAVHDGRTEGAATAER